MNKDKIVFDIETKNLLSDPDVLNNLLKLNISVVGAYSYNQDKYLVFEEHELPVLEEMMKNAGLIIGFYSKKFDVPVLNKYFKFNLEAIPHYDILDEIEKVWGRRISLDLLGEANLGLKKSGHGLDAIDWWNNGEIQKLKDYCVQDVKITKEIFDLIGKQKYLWIPQRNVPEMAKVSLEYKEPEPTPQVGLF
jgi:DEAD/DEAH box helicase domain-containing protein